MNELELLLYNTLRELVDFNSDFAYVFNEKLSSENHERFHELLANADKALEEAVSK